MNWARQKRAKSFHEKGQAVSPAPY